MRSAKRVVATILEDAQIGIDGTEELLTDRRATIRKCMAAMFRAYPVLQERARVIEILDAVLEEKPSHDDLKQAESKRRWQEGE